MQAIHRQDFTPGPSARICSLHFHMSDFETGRMDTNLRRKRKKSPLSIPHLNKAAIPSQFPILPKRLSSSPTLERDDAPTSTHRLERENERLMETIKEFEEEDYIDSLDMLKQKFLCCSSVPGKIILYQTGVENQLTFTNADISDNGFHLNSHVIVKSDLSFLALRKTFFVKKTYFDLRCSLAG